MIDALWYNPPMSKSAMKFCSFSSGSSGNSYLIKTESTALLLDTGITGKQFMAGLEWTETEPEEISGIFITHEHYDHVRGLPVICKRAKEATVYTSQGTLGALAEKLGEKIYDIDFHIISEEEKTIKVGDIEIHPVNLSHDGKEPLGFSFKSGRRKLAVITDTGVISPEIFREIIDADLLALESNYEENMLMMNTNYPYDLKCRIMGEEGHLSNTDASSTIARILSERKKSSPPVILLSHLSGENNTPFNARVTVGNLVKEEGFTEGKDYFLDVLHRDEIGDVYILD